MKYILFVTIVCGTFQKVFLEGNAYSGIQGQGLEKESRNDCDVVIREQYGQIVSPGYPGKYNRYSRCQYTVYRYSPDTCELKLTMDRFEVAKMAFTNCSEDFFEVQNREKRYKLCGELPPGSKKFVYFPNDSDQLVFKFQSTFHQKKGFSIEVKQLPFSCKKSLNEATHATMRLLPPCMQIVGGRIGRITFPDFTDDNLPIERCTYKIKKSEDRACVVQLDFSSFEVIQSNGCETDYLKLPSGQRLCGILGGLRKLLQFSPGNDELILELVSSSSSGNSFDIQVAQLPGPCEYGPPSNTTGQISQQCDQAITAREGRIVSPGFPGPFGPNFRCTYRLYRPDPSVCQIELDFLSFNVGKHNPPSCSAGAYLELTEKNRLCHNMDGKMILKVPEFKDPIVLYFQSDGQSSGRGFDILVSQVPNTCSGYNVQPEIPNAVKRCFQEVTAYSGYFSSYRIHISPGMPMWCEFVVRKADPSVCTFNLHILTRNFLLLSCSSNFIQFPNGDRMCISVTERREVWFPEGAEYTTLIYYNTHNPEFNLFVNQIRNTCQDQNHPNYRSKRRRWAWNYLPR